MTDWTDEDGNSLGEWVPCTFEHYLRTLDGLGNERQVFAGRTEMGDDGNPPRNRHIWTEWGRKGDDAPLVRCHNDYDAWGEHTHTEERFVRADGAS